MNSLGHPNQNIDSHGRQAQTHHRYFVPVCLCRSATRDEGYVFTLPLPFSLLRMWESRKRGEGKEGPGDLTRPTHIPQIVMMG